MNSKLLLKHSKYKNPYGLHNQYMEPMTRKETIHLFNQLEMTNDELIKLNEYIKEHPNHTFYDNAFGLYEDEFTPLNYIEGLRSIAFVQDEIEKDTYDLSKPIRFYCNHENMEWESTLTDIIEYDNYVSVTIRGAGSKIETLIGYNNNYIWICFPYQRLSTTLAHPDDVLWNVNELINLFDSIKDGVTVAYGFKKLYDIKLQSKYGGGKNEF